MQVLLMTQGGLLYVHLSVKPFFISPWTFRFPALTQKLCKFIQLLLMTQGGTVFVCLSVHLSIHLSIHRQICMVKHSDSVSGIKLKLTDIAKKMYEVL